MLKDNPAMLIGGTGRSGTTILAKIIAAHPNVATLPEWRMLSDPGGILEFLAIADGGNPFCIDQAYLRLENFLSRLENKDFVSRFLAKYLSGFEVFFRKRITHKYYGFYAPSYVGSFIRHHNALSETLSDLSFAGKTAATERFQKLEVFATSYKGRKLEKVFSDFLVSIANDAMKIAGCEYFLEKNTWSILSFDRVSRLYPNSKLVHVYRDPRDVVSSYMGQPWMPSEPKKAAVLLFNLYEKWEQQSGLVDASRWIEVSLEKLIVDPKETLEMLCDFWGLDIANEMFDVELNNKSTSRWKKDLSTDDIKDVEAILGKYIDKYSFV